MAVALIESVFCRAVNTRLLDHILHSRDSFFPPATVALFHLYAESVHPPFCLAVAFWSIAVRTMGGCVGLEAGGHCGGAVMSWHMGHMMPAADFFDP